MFISGLRIVIAILAIINFILFGISIWNTIAPDNLCWIDKIISIVMLVVSIAFILPSIVFLFFINSFKDFMQK